MTNDKYISNLRDEFFLLKETSIVLELLELQKKKLILDQTENLDLEMPLFVLEPDDTSVCGFKKIDLLTMFVSK